MRFCAKCGAQLAEGAAFCEKCGCPIGGGQPAASPGGAPADSARTLTLLALIFQSVAAVGLFLPGVYKEIYWKRGPGALDPYTKLWEKAISFFGGTPRGCGILGYLTLLVMAAAITFLALRLLGKGGQLAKMGSFGPALSLVLLILVTVLRCLDPINAGSDQYGPTGHWWLEPNWLFFILTALQLAAAVLALLAARGGRKKH